MANSAQESNSQGVVHVGPIVRWTLAVVVFGNLTRTQHLARAKARLFMKGFTDPDLLQTESHFPTLTREDFMTVVQAVRSHGHRLQFRDVQQAFNTGDPIKREQLLFVRMPELLWTALLVDETKFGSKQWPNSSNDSPSDTGNWER